jgi:hypothetical protein
MARTLLGCRHRGLVHRRRPAPPVPRAPGRPCPLDAVPDPANGLVVYPGRGGGSGSRVPRHPRPLLNVRGCSARSRGSPGPRSAPLSSDPLPPSPTPGPS